MQERIISEVIANAIPEKISNKEKDRLRCEDDRMDYIQEMYAILMEIPDEKILKLYNESKLNDYFAQICINQIINPKSSFYKKYQYDVVKVPITINYKNYEIE